MQTRPVWVEISTSNLIANYHELCLLARRESVPGSIVELLAVVKANAYGHGMRECARALIGAGAGWIGVTSVDEGIEARQVCRDAPILVMSGIWEGEAEAAIEHRLTPVVWECVHMDWLEAAANRHALPARSFRVHMEIDTGMSRQGVRWDEPYLSQMLARFDGRSPLRLDGIATHFSAPEEIDGSETADQLARMDAAVARIASEGHRPAWLHAGNSATILRGGHLPALQRAAEGLGAGLMLRPGLSLYGYSPRFTDGDRQTSLAGGSSPKLSPALTWKSQVTSLRTIQKGESAGYNSTFRAVGPTRLALLPMGYADGLSRSLSNRGHVLLRGERAPIAGRVSMDQTILDVTGIPGVSIGDEAVVIGRQGNVSISAWDIADMTGTIPYEVLCGIAARVPRVPVD